MSVKFYDLTKPKDETSSPERYYFGMLPYINVSWSMIDVLVFVGIFQFAIVLKFDRA